MREFALLNHDLLAVLDVDALRGVLHSLASQVVENVALLGSGHDIVDADGDRLNELTSLGQRDVVERNHLSLSTLKQ